MAQQTGVDRPQDQANLRNGSHIGQDRSRAQDLDIVGLPGDEMAHGCDRHCAGSEPGGNGANGISVTGSQGTDGNMPNGAHRHQQYRQATNGAQIDGSVGANKAVRRQGQHDQRSRQEDEAVA
ncbi:hypothetical protein D3C86_1153880 [compost metagenome]